MRRRPGSIVLCYHRVNDHGDSKRPALSPARFSEHLAWLGTRFRIVAAAEIARSRDAEERRAAITFDDGYPDNVTEALSCLRSADVPATMFAVTGCRVPWTERVHRIPGIATEEVKRRLKRLDPESRDREIDALVDRHGEYEDGETLLGPVDLGAWREAGHEVGAHTRTHPILTRCPDVDLEAEVDGSRQDLERALGEAPSLFAYPGGAFDERTVARVRAAGFDAAFATGGGWVDASSPRFALPRVDVRPDATVAVLAAEISGLLPRLRRVRGRS